MLINCPHCSTALDIAPEYFGQNLVCPACSYMLKTSLLELSGVKEVSFDGAMTTVTYDDEKTNVDALIKVADGMGYPATQVQ